MINNYHFQVLRERSAAIEKGEVGQLINFKIINQLNLKETNKRSFIDMLLMEREKAHLTDTDVREEVDTFMFAGEWGVVFSRTRMQHKEMYGKAIQ